VRRPAHIATRQNDADRGVASRPDRHHRTPPGEPYPGPGRTTVGSHARSTDESERFECRFDLVTSENVFTMEVLFRIDEDGYPIATSVDFAG